MPLDFVSKFYANAPQGYKSNSIFDFLKLCWKNIGMLKEFLNYAKGNGSLANIEKEAQSAIQKGSISAEQVSQIKTAFEIGQSIPDVVSAVKKMF